MVFAEPDLREGRGPGPPTKIYSLHIHFIFHFAQALLKYTGKKILLIVFVAPKGLYIRFGPRPPHTLIRAWVLVLEFLMRFLQKIFPSFSVMNSMIPSRIYCMIHSGVPSQPPAKIPAVISLVH